MQRMKKIMTASAAEMIMRKMRSTVAMDTGVGLSHIHGILVNVSVDSSGVLLVASRIQCSVTRIVGWTK